MDTAANAAAEAATPPSHGTNSATYNTATAPTAEQKEESKSDVEGDGDDDYDTEYEPVDLKPLLLAAKAYVLATMAWTAAGNKMAAAFQVRINYRLM